MNASRFKQLESIANSYIDLGLIEEAEHLLYDLAKDLGNKITATRDDLKIQALRRKQAEINARIKNLKPV